LTLVDASVVAKWFFPEEGSAEARSLLDDPDGVAAPDIVIPETCNLAWKKHRIGQAPHLYVELVAVRLPSLFAEVLPSSYLADRAIEIALMLDHPVYDCFYIAAAERKKAPLFTADRRLLARVKGTAWEDWVRSLR
jgi:predicted nucleic acid-binding protein